MVDQSVSRLAMGPHGRPQVRAVPTDPATAVLAWLMAPGSSGEQLPFTAGGHPPAGVDGLGCLCRVPIETFFPAEGKAVAAANARAILLDLRGPTRVPCLRSVHRRHKRRVGWDHGARAAAPGRGVSEGTAKQSSNTWLAVSSGVVG